MDNGTVKDSKCISTEAACEKILSDIEGVNEQMKDIKQNVEIIQKESKEKQE